MMNRRLHGCFEKIDDHPVHTIPNQYKTKMGVLPKTLVQIILAAKWLVRHSSTFPKQQRRPLPSLLYKSFFCGRILLTAPLQAPTGVGGQEGGNLQLLWRRVGIYCIRAPPPPPPTIQIRVECFLKITWDTFQVVPSCYRTPILKFHFEMLLFNC